LEGPRRVSPNDLAAAFANAPGKPVRAEAVPPETWKTLCRSQGMKNPQPRVRMLDGFNEGWIDDSANARKRSLSAKHSLPPSFRAQRPSIQQLQMIEAESDLAAI
jgi:NAD(P)H dehydrogenase (quinone)